MPGLVILNMFALLWTEMVRFREEIQSRFFEVVLLRRVDKVKLVLFQINSLRWVDEV